jgi:hypothetical protein
VVAAPCVVLRHIPGYHPSTSRPPTPPRASLNRPVALAKGSIDFFISQPHRISGYLGVTAWTACYPNSQPAIEYTLNQIMIETNIHPPVIVRWCCFAIALVAFLACLGSSITLVNNLRTGEAIYSSDFRGIIKENITKESHPEKFEEAQKKLVFQIFYQGALFLVCFTFFKKLGD